DQKTASVKICQDAQPDILLQQGRTCGTIGATGFFCCGAYLQLRSRSMLSTSVTLLERVRQRDDQAAWERFVALYTPLLYRWAQRAGLADQDAADLVQDVFVLLMKELPSFEYDA